jgi:hypothetical protein
MATPNEIPVIRPSDAIRSKSETTEETVNVTVWASVTFVPLVVNNPAGYCLVF